MSRLVCHICMCPMDLHDKPCEEATTPSAQAQPFADIPPMTIAQMIAALPRMPSVEDYCGESVSKDAEAKRYYVDTCKAIRARNELLLAALEGVSSHYSASLDHQPPYVAQARAVIAACRT